MATHYHVRQFIWDNGRWIDLGPVTAITTETSHAAAERVTGVPMVSVGPIDRVALKVWERGKARKAEDVRHYWRAGL